MPSLSPILAAPKPALLPPAPRALQPVPALPAAEPDHFILDERLMGDAARRRSTAASPDGAGLSPELAAKVEYVEVWRAPNPPLGVTYRMYDFGGRLVAVRSAGRV